MPNVFWDIKGLFLTGKKYGVGRGGEEILQLGESQETNFTGVCVNLSFGFYGLFC